MSKNYKRLPHDEDGMRELISKLETIYTGRNFEEIQSIAFNLSSFVNATMFRIGLLNISERLPEFRGFLASVLHCYIENEGFGSTLSILERPDSPEYFQFNAQFIHSLERFVSALNEGEEVVKIEDFGLQIIADYLEMRKFMNFDWMWNQNGTLPSVIDRYENLLRWVEHFLVHPHAMALSQN